MSSGLRRHVPGHLFAQRDDALASGKRLWRALCTWPGGLKPLPNHRVVVTGVGLVTPLGVNVPSTWDALLAGQTGIKKLLPEHVPREDADVVSRLASQVVGVVDSQAFAKSFRRLQDSRRSSRYIDFARCAADEALGMARFSPSEDVERDTTGVCIGSAMSGVAEIVTAGGHVRAGNLRRVSPYFVPKVLTNMPAGVISIDHGLRGPNAAPATACATGLHAVGEAFRQVQRGEATVMLAGSGESCIDATSINGFCRMKALSTSFNSAPHVASRPFDACRDGFVMAEGAGVLVLEEREHALRRGASILAEIRGFGMSGDAHHITSPSSAGHGAALAMQRALRHSGMSLEDVRYINAHATSTPLGDAVEQKAIGMVFGEHVNDGNLSVSSTKGATGHLLGAAGAVEAVFTVLALHAGICPATTNLFETQHTDIRCLLKHGSGHILPPQSAALCNSFGFGGTNASLLMCSAHSQADNC